MKNEEQTRDLVSGEELFYRDEIWWGGQWRRISMDGYSRAYVPNVIGVHYRRIVEPETFMKAHTTEGESAAIQVGRDDYKACRAVADALGLEDGYKITAPTPFPQGSEDAEQWQEGWNRERDGK